MYYHISLDITLKLSVFLIMFVPVLLALALVAVSSAKEVAPIIIVDGLNGSSSHDCWSDTHENTTARCKTLKLALEGAQAADGQVAIIILPGEYQLQADSNLTIFTNAANFMMTGSGSPGEVVIHCNHKGGLVFVASINVTIETITFAECRSHNHLLDKMTVVGSGLLFYDCADITLRSVEVVNSNGVGMLFYNSLGTNVITTSTFRNNSCLESDCQPGGGVVVYLYFCSTSSSISDDCSQQDQGANYTFTGCKFESNVISGFPIYSHNSSLKTGGGLSVNFVGNTGHVSIEIEQCIFTNNIGPYGGGIFTELSDYSQWNTLLVKQSIFDSNKLEILPWYIGGAARIDVLSEDVQHNTILFTDTLFVGNSALQGGALFLRLATHLKNTNLVALKTCNFTSNVANLGAALTIATPFFDQGLHVSSDFPPVHLVDCHFNNNSAIPSITDILSPVIGLGAVYFRKVSIAFAGHLTFANNSGTALIVDSSVTIQSECSVLFSRNRGVKGGAVLAFNTGKFVLSAKTILIFESNIAVEFGGAIFAAWFGSDVISLQSHCFVEYFDDTIDDPSKWDTILVFSENIASTNPNSIWISSITSCMRNHAPRIVDNATLCWDNWNYVNSSCDREVVTGPAQIIQDSSIPAPYLFPGIQTSLPIKILDEWGHDITASELLTVFVTEGEGAVRYDDLHVNGDSFVSIYGVPNTTISLELQTSGLLALVDNISVNVLPCPPGFIAQPLNLSHSELAPNLTRTCVCSGDYGGMVTCHDNHTASLRYGCAMSYQEETGHVFVGITPYSQSSFHSKSLPQNVSELDSYLCGDLHRTGLLCSKCKPGYSLTFKLEVECVNCTASLASSWFIAITANVLPVTIFYLIVVLFDVNAASANLNSLIFFSQIITFPLRLRLLKIWRASIPDSKVVNTLFFTTHYLSIFYRIWNLDFGVFQVIPGDTMCLLREPNVMANLSLQYLISVYPIILISINSLLIELYARNFKPVVWAWKPFRTCFLRFKRKVNPRHSIIHAFITFYIISYVRILSTSMELLSSTKVWDTYTKKSHSVLYYDASIEWFGKEHLPYALLAIVVLIVIIFTLPIFLLLYPLKIFQILMNKCTCIKLQYIHIFMDSFQGSFKDGTGETKDRRYFAGLYLIFRIVTITIYSVISTTHNIYLALIIFYIILVPMFALLRPYKKDLYNYLDTGVFTLLVLKVFVEFFNYHTLLVGRTSEFLTLLPLFLYYTPLVVVLCFLFYWVTIKLIKVCNIRRRIRLEAITTSIGFPDRVLNPDRYCKLPRNTDENNSNCDDSGNSREGASRNVSVNSQVLYGSMVCVPSPTVVSLSTNGGLQEMQEIHSSI